MVQMEEIVKSCISGKRTAQNQLYQLFSKKMFGLCYRYCKNETEAEDMLQEGFIKIFENLKHLRDISSIDSWMKRIMINTLINNYNRTNRQVFTIESVDDFAAINNKHPYFELEEENNLYSQLKTEDLIQIIRNMPLGYSLVLNMFVFEEYSHKEIARQLKITESTSKTQLFKARKYLRKKILSHLNMDYLELKNERKVQPY
ncbi:RNA polymerase sigma factor [Bacteroidota bacterium]